MKAPYFTVLIDTCNYWEFIEQAVASALAQEFPAEEREILVVHDGSTDVAAISSRCVFDGADHICRFRHSRAGISREISAARSESVSDACGSDLPGPD